MTIARLLFSALAGTVAGAKECHPMDQDHPKAGDLFNCHRECNLLTEWCVPDNTSSTKWSCGKKHARGEAQAGQPCVGGGGTVFCSNCPDGYFCQNDGAWNWECDVLASDAPANSSQVARQVATEGAVASCAPVGPGCCHGTTSHPASSKIVDGLGYSAATCQAACTGGCEYFTFKSGWCTAWSASMTNCLPLATGASDCGSDYSAATTYRCGGAPSQPTCSHGRFSWASCAGHRTCASSGWDGCAQNVCQQKISSGQAVSMCETAGGTTGCDYGSDANTCAYDAAGVCCYSDVTEALVI